MQRSLAFAIAAAIAMSVSAPALARTPAAPSTAAVQYADLNVNSEAGAETLLRRIRTAARDVCDVRPGHTSLTIRMSRRACVQETMNRTITELNMPMVTIAHLEHGGRISRVSVAAR